MRYTDIMAAHDLSRMLTDPLFLIENNKGDILHHIADCGHLILKSASSKAQVEVGKEEMIALKNFLNELFPEVK